MDLEPVVPRTRYGYHDGLVRRKNNPVTLVVGVEFLARAQAKGTQPVSDV